MMPGLWMSVDSLEGSRAPFFSFWREVRIACHARLVDALWHALDVAMWMQVLQPRTATRWRDIAWRVEQL